ncbi:FlgD immunoglobulin-like domain containing protein [Kineosporia succinea]|uniref:FlgD/Vpr Ig-like domain-containing protein n=1 Tax=Kineosporia succinea TaxID=84632 RepID=A0ABT9NVY0_9ACTN|nr:FlgD immunoglobulin-like domain containing protein [Kineosporia succinea]MDP9824577.1 hypothetical protein [Kineosporia succinea]
MAPEPVVTGPAVTGARVVRPRSAPDLEVRIEADDTLSVSRDVPPPPGPPENPETPGAGGGRPAHPMRHVRLVPGVLALSLVLSGAVDAPGSSDEPVRTREQALTARTVTPAASLVLSGHPAPSAVRLIGASEHGIAIWQGAAGGLDTDLSRPQAVYTGALTGADGTMRLTERPGAGASTRAGALVRLSVAGPVLTWYELGGEGDTTAYPQEKRLDLAGGADVTDDRTASLAVRQKIKGGGATTPYTQIDGDGTLATTEPGRWLEFGGLSARIVAHEGRWVLESRRGGEPVTRAVLPQDINVNSGLDAVGDRLYTVSSGLHPAVWVVQGSRVTKVADVPAARYPIGSWALSGGSVHYTDHSSGKRAHVFSSTVSGTDGSITLGPTKRGEQVAGTTAGGTSPARGAGGTTIPIGWSAGRAALADPRGPGQWQLLDQGRTNAVVGQRLVTLNGEKQRVDDATPAVSGSYTLVAGQVFRPDGELVWTEPAAAALAGQDDLYGADIVYSVPAGGQDDEGNDLAGVWSVNAERPLPVRLDTESCATAPEVAIWAGSAAWATCDGSRITVQDLTTGQIRDVDTGLGLIVGSDPAPITGLTLGEGLLAWKDGNALSLLDLSDAGSSPIVLPGATGRFTVDAGLVAREVTTGGASELVIDKAPFTVNQRPRLIAAAAPLGFTPDGDGRQDTWKPQFDVTRPVEKARLRILAPSGRVMRTFEIKGGGDGSLRGITWDGRSNAGMRLPEGPYDWELTATATDGGGTLTSADSPARARGTIEISAVAPERPGAR